MLTQILIFSTAVEGIRNTTDPNFIIMCGKSPRELQIHKNPASTASLAWCPPAGSCGWEHGGPAPWPRAGGRPTFRKAAPSTRAAARVRRRKHSHLTNSEWGSRTSSQSWGKQDGRAGKVRLHPPPRPRGHRELEVSCELCFQSQAERWREDMTALSLPLTPGPPSPGRHAFPLQGSVPTLQHLCSLSATVLGIHAQARRWA